MNTLNEIWKPVRGYEGLYEVSNLGRVKSLSRITGSIVRKDRIMAIGKGGNNNYQIVQLTIDGNRKTYLIHRLVAEAFIQNPDNLPQVNHKDENPTNNCVDNLEWCTAKYNANFGSRNEKTAEKCSKPVHQYTLDGEYIKTFKSVSEAAKAVGGNKTNISACCLGKKCFKTAYNFIWMY